HRAGGLVVGRVGGSCAVLQKQAFVTPVVGLPHGRMNADVGGDPRQNQIADSPGSQEEVQIGGVEGALPGFVDDDFSLQGIQFRDDVPPLFSTDENPAAGARVADPGADLPAAPSLVGRQIRQIGSVSFPCV